MGVKLLSSTKHQSINSQQTIVTPHGIRFQSEKDEQLCVCPTHFIRPHSGSGPDGPSDGAIATAAAAATVAATVAAIGSMVSLFCSHVHVSGDASSRGNGWIEFG